MSVWLCVPSARPVKEVDEWCLKWKAMGYLVSLWRDPGKGLPINADLFVEGDYPGYPVATNTLIRSAFDSGKECDWVVAAGDDTNPDPNHTAEEIAESCTEYFAVHSHYPRGATFGVVQPTGDRWGDDVVSRRMWPDAPAMIDRICGSPWIGREFARRINGGVGPFWPEYHHNWCDEELQNVALKLGVLWQRRDLIHFHDHARRNGGKWKEHQQGFDADYVKMKPLFDKRKAAGFPGHEVIA